MALEIEPTELLAELKIETEKLLALLKDNEIGLMTWWTFLKDRLEAITQIKQELGI